MSGQALLGVSSPCFSITVGTSASSAVPIQASNSPKIRLVSKNSNTDMIYVAVGTAANIAATIPTTTPTTTCTPVLPGSDVEFDQPYGTQLYISAISGTAAQTLFVQNGDGN